MQLYSLRDNKTSTFNNVMQVPHVAVLLREFGDVVNGEKKPGSIAAHPQDFEVYHIGSFDQQTGSLTPISPPVFITCLQDLTVKQVGQK